MESAKDTGKNVESNKHQEALDVLATDSLYLNKEMYETNEGLDSANKETFEFKKTIQELVDKATPIKPIIKITPLNHLIMYDYYCPVCKCKILYKGCCSNNDCRQAIDWSEDEN